MTLEAPKAVRARKHGSRLTSSTSLARFSVHRGTLRLPAFRSRGRPSRRARGTAHQLAHAHQVIGAENETCAQTHSCRPPLASPPQAPNLLGPAKDFLDLLAQPLTGLIAEV